MKIHTALLGTARWADLSTLPQQADGCPRGQWLAPLFWLRGSFPGLGDLKETKMFVPHPLEKLNIVGSLRDREVACSASDLQGSNFESCVWMAASTHHPQEVLLAQFGLYVHKGGLKHDSFHFHSRPSPKGSGLMWWWLVLGWVHTRRWLMSV